MRPLTFPFFLRRLFPVLPVLLVAAAGMAAPSFAKTPVNKPPQVNVVLATWPGYGAVLVGKEKSFFEGIDVNYQIIDDIPALRSAFQSGQMQVMVTTLDAAPIEATQGLNGKVALLFDKSNGGDAVIVKNSVKSLKDLKGKKVAVIEGTNSEWFLYNALKSAGLDLKDVELVAFGDAAPAGQAFAAGHVDAVSIWEPFVTDYAKAGGGYKAISTRELPGTVMDVAVASPALLADADRWRKFAAGFIKANDFIRDNPEEAARIIAKHMSMKPSEAKAMMAGIEFAGTAMTRDYFCGKKAQSMLRLMEEAGDVWFKKDIITAAPPKADTLLDKSVCAILGAGGKE